MPSRQWKYRKKRIAEGRCPQCGKPALSGHIHCVICGIKKNEAQRRLLGRIKRNSDVYWNAMRGYVVTKGHGYDDGPRY